MATEDWELSENTEIDISTKFSGEASLRFFNGRIGEGFAIYTPSREDKPLTVRLETQINVSSNSSFALEVPSADDSTLQNAIGIVYDDGADELETYFSTEIGSLSSLVNAGNWDDLTLSDGSIASSGWFKIRLDLWVESGTLYGEVFEDADGDGVFTKLGSTHSTSNSADIVDNPEFVGFGIKDLPYNGTGDLWIDQTELYY